MARHLNAARQEKQYFVTLSKYLILPIKRLLGSKNVPKTTSLICFFGENLDMGHF